MRELILIKHASPQVLPGKPASQWPLSPAGRERCELLAQRLAPHAPTAIICSKEPKAVQTGQTIGQRLNVPVEQAADLHEHLRETVPHLRTQEFISLMALLFQKPTERILGEETAAQARERFARAMDAILASHPAGNLAVVTHGTVLSLFVAQHTSEDPFQLWRRMGLPSFVVLSLPEWQVVEMVDRVEEER